MPVLANGDIIKREFHLWRARQNWGGVSSLDALNAAEDALDDIIHNRMNSKQLTAKQVIAMKELGEL